MSAPFKEQLNVQRVEELAASLDLSRAFVQQATNDLGELELKDRVILVSDALAAHLPKPVPVALDHLVARYGWQEPTDLGLWPVLRFVEDHALEHPTEALLAMRALTSTFSAEFAVRPYLRRYPEQALDFLRANREHPSQHVRRWVSEGSRPRLPWGARLRAFQHDPQPVLELIEALLDDPEEYVRRSVANNLNDISKDHPELLVAWCAQRMQTSRKRLFRHALRGLLKAGQPQAMELMGFGSPRLEGATLKANSPVRIGEKVEIVAVLELANPQPLMLDLAIEYVDAKGGRSRRKVFKGGVKQAPAGTFTWSKRLNMKQVSVRRLYPGEHAVQLLVNGVPSARAVFTLVDPAADEPPAGR